MKKLTRVLSLSFFLINVIGIFTYFWLNVNLYIKYSETSQITSTNMIDLQNAYDFLKNKVGLNNNFTTLEASHLQDVKNIFSIVYYIFQISLILFVVITLFFIFSHQYNQIWKWLFIWSIISLSIVLLLLILTVSDFTSSFQVFHKIFFPQWNRTFAEDSRLITLFPESFFISISKSIFLTISVISVSIIWLNIIFRVRS